MKKPEEYLEMAFESNLTRPLYEIKDSKTVILAVIKQAQKEAYNEALEDVIKNAEVFIATITEECNSVWKDDYTAYLNEESILKLKKK